MSANIYGLPTDTYTKLYAAWYNMLRRCYNENSERFYTYGERGIVVCDAWRTDFHSFAKWMLENGWKPRLSIERKDVDGTYCPENCTIIPVQRQPRNKTNNIRIVIGGEERCLTEWCEIFGIPFKLVWKRYRVFGIRDIDSLFYPGDLRDRRSRIMQIAPNGEVIAEHVRIGDAVKKSGVSKGAIYNACKGLSKTAGGYVWRYADEASA